MIAFRSGNGRGVVVTAIVGDSRQAACRTAACPRSPRAGAISPVRRTRLHRTAVRAGCRDPRPRTSVPSRRWARQAADCEISSSGRSSSPMDREQPGNAFDHHAAHVAQRFADQRDRGVRAHRRAAGCRALWRAPIRRLRASCRRRVRRGSARRACHPSCGRARRKLIVARPDFPIGRERSREACQGQAARDPRGAAPPLPRRSRRSAISRRMRSASAPAALLARPAPWLLFRARRRPP